jgi:hypothetical protein
LSERATAQEKKRSNGKKKKKKKKKKLDCRFGKRKEE